MYLIYISILVFIVIGLPSLKCLIVSDDSDTSGSNVKNVEVKQRVYNKEPKLDPYAMFDNFGIFKKELKPKVGVKNISKLIVK